VTKTISDPQISAIQQRFSEIERLHLLRSPGLGPLVVRRLEDSGIASIATLRRMGADVVVLAMCQPGTNLAWFNRRRALQRAIDSYST
jgi:hypothetical protein